VKMLRQKKIWIGFGTALLSTLLLVWCFRKVEWGVFLEHLENIKIYYLILGVTSTFIILLMKSFQIRVYLPPHKKLPLHRIFQVVSILMMTVSLLPFWGGHALFIYLLGHREGVGKTVALSIITLEQIVEGIGKLFIFGVVLLAVPLPPWMGRGIKSFLILVTAAFSVLLLLAYFFRDLDQKKGNARYPRLTQIYHLFFEWAHHLKPLKDWRTVGQAAFLSILMKCLETSAVFMVQKSFGVELPFYAPFLVVAALSLATVLPLSPGRLGVFEATAFVVYQSLGVDSTLAIALGLFIHMVHSLPLILTGYFVSLKIGFKRKEAFLDPPEGVVFAGGPS
jgi:glycosyltransferase 2 family protein